MFDLNKLTEIYAQCFALVFFVMLILMGIAVAKESVKDIFQQDSTTPETIESPQSINHL